MKQQAQIFPQTSPDESFRDFVVRYRAYLATHDELEQIIQTLDALIRHLKEVLAQTPANQLT